MMADPEQSQLHVGSTSIGRIVTVNDMDFGAPFPASEESYFVTGSELVIYGGYAAQ